jgi:Tol biopolymer transport system component/DNA-binding winged helix-turn-helix (wHTH) protein
MGSLSKGLWIADEACGSPMNKLPRNLGASRPIEIGAEPDFSLGGLSIHPSTRELSVDDRRETVEPRVMQVLVALVRAGGGVVSRDRLIEQCWGGRLVGDDAINSCVAKVRALAALTTPSAFDIETIPRVGYRLHARTPIVRETELLRSMVSSSDLKTRPRRILLWIAAACAGIAVLVAGAVWWFLRPDPSLDWIVVESHQPFIGTSLIERHPAISPDGTMLAYSAGINLTNRQIYLRIIKGDSSLQLTHETFDAASPVWSPDGTTLAYSVFQSGHPCRIMELAIPAGAPHTVGRCRNAERTKLAFNPSGRALVFADSPAAGMPTQLVRFDLESGKTTPLTDPPKTTLGDDEPNFSPDGRYLAYVREFGGIKSEIRVRRISDGRDSLVEKLNGCEGGGATWTPDGAAILTSRRCPGSYSLWALSLDGKAGRQIFTSTSGVGQLSVNPNGWVAMETFGGHAPILAFRPGTDVKPAPLAESSGLTSDCADFASDGALVVTGSIESKFGVWMADYEGAPFRKLMSLPQFACAIRWSPDGSRFGLSSRTPKAASTSPSSIAMGKFSAASTIRLRKPTCSIGRRTAKAS